MRSSARATSRSSGGSCCRARSNRVRPTSLGVFARRRARSSASSRRRAGVLQLGRHVGERRAREDGPQQDLDGPLRHLRVAVGGLEQARHDIRERALQRRIDVSRPPHGGLVGAGVSAEPPGRDLVVAGRQVVAAVEGAGHRLQGHRRGGRVAVELGRVEGGVVDVGAQGRVAPHESADRVEQDGVGIGQGAGNVAGQTHGTHVHTGCAGRGRCGHQHEHEQTTQKPHVALHRGQMGAYCASTIALRVPRPPPHGRRPARAVYRRGAR